MSHILESTGLSAAEVRVYESLLKLGATTTGDLVSDSGVASSHIYEILDRLVEKGLATYYLSKNIKHFEAADPKKITELYEHKKQEVLDQQSSIQQEVSRLSALATTSREDADLKVYEGFRGVRTAVQKAIDTLQPKETYYVLGAPLISNEKLNAFYRDLHEQRIEKGIRFKIIYNESAREYAQERSDLELTDIRIIDEDTPTELCVFGEYAQIIIFSQHPICIEVRSQEVAKSFLTYFNTVWSSAESLPPA